MQLARKLADLIMRDSAPARCMRRDAESGRAYAQAALGDMYRKGTLVHRNYAEAVKWYRLAAEQGDALAQFNLGAHYSSGRGVPKDAIVAYMWFELSLLHGTGAARDIRRVVARQLSPHQVERAEKMARDWMKTRVNAPAQA